MTTPCALRLARVTAAQAEALTTIARHGSDRYVAPASGRRTDGKYAGPWRLRMRSHLDFGSGLAPDPRDAAAKPTAFRSMRFDWKGASLFLRLPPRICDDWLAVRLPELQMDALPTHFIDAAWEAMLDEALKAFGVDLLCPGMRSVSADTSGAQADCPYAWTVSIQSADEARAIDVELAMDEAGLRQVADLMRRLPAPAPDTTVDVERYDNDYDAASPLNRLAVVVRTDIGQTMLDTAALRSLQVGDVVLFDRCLVGPDGDIWLTTPDGQGLRAHPYDKAASRYVVTQEWNLIMNDLSPDMPDEEDDSTFDPRRDTQFDVPYDSELDERLGRRHDAPNPRVPGASGEFGAFEPPRDPAAMDDDDWPPAAMGDRYADPPMSAAGKPEQSNPGSGRMGAGPDPYAADPYATAPYAADPVSPGDGLNVDRIPVRLNFDLGEQSLTLGELRRLQPGEYFDLQRRIDGGPVHIRANGTLIGTAELVDIEGRIGARVLTLTLDRDSCR